MGVLEIPPSNESASPVVPNGAANPNAPEVVTPHSEMKDERKEQSADMAEKLLEAKLDDNKYSRVYIEMKEFIKDNPNMDGPIARFALALLKTGALGMGFASRHISGFVKKNLDENPKYKDLEFSIEELNELNSGNTHEVPNLGPTQDLLTQETNSTRFACAYLGIDSLDDPLSLQAKLWHSKTTTADGKDAKYYSEINFAGVGKQGLPKGAVIFVSKINMHAEIGDVVKSPRLVYVATGNGMECVGYDPDTGGKRTYDFRELFSNDSDEATSNRDSMFISNLGSAAKFSSLIYTPNFKKGGQKSPDR